MSTSVIDTMKRRTIRGAGGVELAVRETAAPPDAPTIVLIHGYPDTSATWDPVVPHLADYHVVTYDYRGAGASSAPDSPAGYSLDLLVEDLAAVVEATSPERPVHLVGHDWGSVQGWEAVGTERLSGRIASYTSMSGPCLDHVGYWVRHRVKNPSWRHFGQLVRQGIHSWYIAAFGLPGAPLFWRRGGARLVDRSLKLMGELPPDTGLAPSLPSDGANGVNLYRTNVRERLSRPHERQTDMPVQLLVPTGDRYVTPALLDDVTNWAPRLWRRDVPGTHWLHLHHPERVARWIRELVDHAEGGPEPSTLRRHRVTYEGADEAKPDAGKVVVITGAGSGIGRQTALAFAERGATVVVADLDVETAERTALLCRDLGAKATHHQVDVGDADAMEALAKTVEQEYDCADVVVNNAGIGMAGRFLDTSDGDWERLLRVNLWGVIHGARLFGRQMERRGEGGHIVNVASAAAFTPSRAYPAYATSKAAVLMLSECIRAELADEDIGVTAICPGIVNTGIIAATRFVGVDDAEQERRRRATKRLYALRSFTPDQVADAVVGAVRRNQAVVPVAAEARLGRAMSRFAPGLARRLARLDPTTRLMEPGGRSR